MQFEEVIEIVSELFRISQWSANEYGERYAILDNDIEIRTFPEGSNVLVLQGMFGEPISGYSQMNTNESKFKYLLQANFMRIIQQNDVLSIDGQSDRLCVTRRVVIGNITAENLLNEVEDFVQNVDFWDVIARKKRASSTMSPLLGLFNRR